MTDQEHALATIEEPQQALSLFRTDDAAEITRRAAEVATALAAVIEEKHLYQSMGKDKDGRERRHVLVDGWTMCGTLVGVYPITVRTTRLMTTIDGIETEWGWEAYVEVRTKQGEVVGGAESMCTRDEEQTRRGGGNAYYPWRDRPSYALRSMAQTRAIGKALRQALGFIVSLAGYQATPAEEMGDAEIVHHEPASVETLDAIRDYVMELEVDLDKFLRFYQVESIDDLNVNAAAHALRKLQDKHAQARGGEIKASDPPAEEQAGGDDASA